MKKLNDWRPSASNYTLIKRAAILYKIRSFFYNNNVMEVETPILSRFETTDIYIKSFQTNYIDFSKNKKIKLWLVTSPEYHMKRLLSSNIGSIYQISHSFRNEERGFYHNPEFSMLEWYQIDCDMHCMIKAVDVFLKHVLNYTISDKISYQEVFIKYLDIDPLSSKKNVLLKKFKELKIMNLIDSQNDSNKLLEILFMVGIEPYIGKTNPIFIYHFPQKQAALSSINIQDNRVCNRFEVFFKGIELGNGFEELTDSSEQRKRFEDDNKFHLKNSKKIRCIDNLFLNALSYGLPQCSGIAIGIDRLIMIALNAKTIDEVIAFPIERC